MNFKNVSYALANHHQRWICYELACGKLISNFLECGPSASGVGVTKVGDKPNEIQESLFTTEPHLNSETPIFHPRWVRRNGTIYQCNNTFLITGSDGLDPTFSHLDDCWWGLGYICCFGVQCQVL